MKCLMSQLIYDLKNIKLPLRLSTVLIACSNNIVLDSVYSTNTRSNFSDVFTTRRNWKYTYIIYNIVKYIKQDVACYVMLRISPLVHLCQSYKGQNRPTSDVDNIFSKMCSQYVLFRNKYSKLICAFNSSQRTDKVM